MYFSNYTSQKTKNGFLEFSSRNLKKKSTSESYLRELNFLMDFHEVDAENITKEHANQYLTDLYRKVKTKELSYDTVARKFKQLSSMFSFFYITASDKFKTYKLSPFSDIYIKEPMHIYNEDDILTYEEINSFFDFVHSQSKKDYILLQTMYFSLLKPSELLSLDTDDLLFKKDCLTIKYRGSKKYKKRDIRIPFKIGELLKDNCITSDFKAIFKNKTLGRLSLRSLQDKIKKYSDDYSKTSKTITATLIYHTAIYHALLAGMSKELLVYQLGITDTKFLDRYLISDISDEEITSSCDYIKISLV